MQNKLITALLIPNLLASRAACAEIVEICNFCSENQMKNKALSKIKVKDNTKSMCLI